MQGIFLPGTGEIFPLGPRLAFANQVMTIYCHFYLVALKEEIKWEGERMFILKVTITVAIKE